MWISTCRSCQKNKISREKIFEDVGELPKTSLPFNRVHIDIVGPVKVSTAGNKYILVMVDAATKYILAEAISNIDEDTTCKVVDERLFCVKGHPFIIYCDRGSNFVSKKFHDMCESMGVDIKHTVSHNPRADGQVERANATIIDLLKNYVDSEGTNWDTILSKVVMAYNSSPNATTGVTPYELVYGRPATTILDVTLGKEKLVILKEWLEKRMKDYLELVEKEKVQKKPIQVKTTFKVGEKVARKNFYMVQADKSTKFEPRWLGPLEVVDVSTPLTPKLRDENGDEDFVHVTQLKRWRELDELVGESKRDLETRRRELNRKPQGELSEPIEDKPYEPTEMIQEPSITPVTAEGTVRRSTRARVQTRRENFMSSEYIAWLG